MLTLEEFFTKAVERTKPTTPDGIMKLAAECAIYFNDHKEGLDTLKTKMTYVLDSAYPRSKGAPSFENSMWALALIACAWSGFLREAKAIDRNTSDERELLLRVVIPSFAQVAEIGRQYAIDDIRSAEQLQSS